MRDGLTLGPTLHHVPFGADTAAQQDFERIEAMNMEIGLKTAHDGADATEREKVSRDHDSE